MPSKLTACADRDGGRDGGVWVCALTEQHRERAAIKFPTLAGYETTARGQTSLRRPTSRVQTIQAIPFANPHTRQGL
jgi:hypothetical protein